MIYNAINLLTAEELCNLVREDLVERNVLSVEEVVYGDWQIPRQGKINPIKSRVVFSLGSGNFSINEAGPQNFPGGAYDYVLGSPAPVFNARSLWTIKDSVLITVEGTSEPQRGDNSALLAQRKIIALRNLVLAAIYRVAHGSVTPTNGQWIQPQSNEFTFGSRLQFEVLIDVPVLDDASMYLGEHTKEAAMYLNDTLDGYVSFDGYA